MRDALQTAITEPTGQPRVADEAAASEEQQLVAAVIRKDRKATADFVGRFADPVHAYVRQRLIPRTDPVDDLVQEVFLAALKGLPSFAGRSSLKGWLLGIARHKIEDHYRAHLRRSETTSDFDDDSSFVPVEFPEFDERIDHARRRDKTRRVLSRLPEAYGYALLWRYWEKRSVKGDRRRDRTDREGRRAAAGTGTCAVQTAVGS